VSTSENNLRLRIEPATRLTEITVSDARFRKIPLEENVGTIELELPLGVYEIGFRDGTSIEQHMVVLHPHQAAPFVVQQKPLPIDDDKDAEDALGDEPSSLLVVVRDPRRSSFDRAEDAPPSSATRLDGLSLVTEDSKLIAPGASSVSEARSLLPLPAVPGRYRLRVQTGIGDQVFETPIVICPGWRTQVWLRTRAYRPGDYRADFATTEVQMRPADGSRRPSEEERILERNARASLVARRTLGGRTFNALLRGMGAQKYLNPMPPAGFAHPDVKALTLRLSLLRKEEPSSVQPFPFPPMLADSWRTILQIAERWHEAIPPGSLCDRVANRVVSAGAFTVWVAPNEQVAAEAAAPVSPPGIAPKPGARRTRRDGRARTEFAVNPSAPPEQVAAPIVSPEVGIRLIDAALHDQRLRQWFRGVSGMSRGSSQEDEPQTPEVPIVSKTERMVAQSIQCRQASFSQTACPSGGSAARTSIVAVATIARHSEGD
jgi:hypothetical protein